MILDPACGGRMFYFDKNDDRVLFCDIRNFETELVDNRFFAVKPDLRIDFTDMPFGDEQFNMVVFDPPHLLSKNELDEETGFMKIKYGSLKINNWKETLKKGFAECFRVLRVGGGAYIQMERDRYKSERGFETYLTATAFGSTQRKTRSVDCVY